ncbi:MAG TPA: serine/threonine-protein kinase [Polyangia bacterium]|nr:serine/threonine-protein kinase [Polyangia bacterium]
MTPESVPIAEGEIVGGKYRVGRALGQGGMGVVVAATHVQLEQRVALKFLRAEALRNPEVVARFKREAQAAAKIQSVHVARVLDVGELRSGAPYMVMEYLEGEDLEQVLARRGPLEIAEAVELLLQGCEAVAEAHRLGIVHRDLKPANLFLARYPDGRQMIKVLDFGISKLQGPMGSPGLTQAASMFGSPPYMSPEQVRSTRSVDVRSDIWSLGAVLYELLTRQTPFPAETAPVLLAAILHTEPAPPGRLRAGIPPLLEAAVMRCLQKDPALRFQDVGSLAAAVAPFGPPSSADSVARISHLLGLVAAGAAPSPMALPADSGAAPALAPAVTAPTPETRTAKVAATQVAPAPARAMRATMPMARPAAAASLPKTRVLRTGIPRAALLVAVILMSATAAAAYWFGARGGQPPAAASLPAPSPTSLPAPSPTPAPATQPAVAPAPAAAPPSREVTPATSAAPAPAAAAPGSAGERHPTRSAKARERPAANPGASSPTGAVAGSTAAPAATSAKAPSPPSAACAELLERQSLGETLTPQEASVYARDCKKR